MLLGLISRVHDMNYLFFLWVDADLLFLAMCQNQRMEIESAKINACVENICVDASKVQVCHSGRPTGAGWIACIVK
jgi:hypothetical protein